MTFEFAILYEDFIFVWGKDIDIWMWLVAGDCRRQGTHSLVNSQMVGSRGQVTDEVGDLCFICFYF